MPPSSTRSIVVILVGSSQPQAEGVADAPPLAFEQFNGKALIDHW
jgi:hypothetical protein